MNGQMNVNTNGGVLVSEQQGCCQSLGKIWCHQNAMTNMLSFNQVKDLFRITCDSDMEGEFLCTCQMTHKQDLNIVEKDCII